MDGVHHVDPVALSNLSRSADETKYDGRNMRDKLALLHRAAILLLVLVALITMFGDGMLVRSKIQRQELLRSSGVHLVRGERVRSRFDPISEPAFDDNLEAERLARQEAAERALLDAKRKADATRAAQKGLADAWGEEADEAHHHKPIAATLFQANAVAVAGSDPLPAVHGADWRLLPPETCDGYFGNGYSEFQPLVGGSTGPGEYLWCRAHPTTHAFYCRAHNLLIKPSDIKLSRGGEELEQVMGRSEDIELPVFGLESMRIIRVPKVAGQPALPPQDHPAPLNAAFSGMGSNDGFKFRMLNVMRVATAESTAQGGCKTFVTGPVLFLTRVEYANLFHTSTDWFNAWQVARILGFVPTADYAGDALFGLTPEMKRLEASAPRTRIPRLPLHVVFLDGHNAGPMDEGWLALFLSFNYIKHLPDGVCFEDAIFAPYGYHAAISQGMQPRGSDCREESHVLQFGADMVTGLGLVPRSNTACEESPSPVLFVRRTHYLAHPRHNGQVVRRLDNEDEVFEAVAQHAKQGSSGMRLVNGDFAKMSLREQVDSAQSACLIVGAHGAGLTHVLFAPPGVHVLELRTPAFRRPHFIAYSFWSGAHHHDWSLETSTPAPSQVVQRVAETLFAADKMEHSAGH